MIPVRYTWLYIPTGETGTHHFSTRIGSSIAAYKQLNQWNHAGAGTWQYWIDEGNVWTWALRPDETRKD
jgi:hypothetical protein